MSFGHHITHNQKPQFHLGIKSSKNLEILNIKTLFLLCSYRNRLLVLCCYHHITRNLSDKSHLHKLMYSLKHNSILSLTNRRNYIHHLNLCWNHHKFHFPLKNHFHTQECTYLSIHHCYLDFHHHKFRCIQSYYSRMFSLKSIWMVKSLYMSSSFLFSSNYCIHLKY